MPKPSRTKRTPHVRTSRNALYLLLAFYAGLMTPIAVLCVHILSNPPAPTNELEAAQSVTTIPNPVAPSTTNNTLDNQDSPLENLDLSTLPQVYVDYNYDVYYIALDSNNGEPESTLIAAAEYPPTCPGADSTSFCQKQYHRAIISPNGKWVFLEGVCWEENCYSVYDLTQDKQYELTTSPLYTHWLPDNRLYGDGGFTTPKVVPSDAWESVSSAMPWQMKKVSE